MAKLRLFANLREIAGETQVEIDADTVGAVVDNAIKRFGPEFKRGVESARVWVNGDPAPADAPVGVSDEVVLLPPVSGGAQPAQAVAAADFVGFLPLAFAILAFIANLQGQAIWGAFLVLAAACSLLEEGICRLSRQSSQAPLELSQPIRWAQRVTEFPSE
jgi:molybdopterin converting factor small subunit